MTTDVLTVMPREMRLMSERILSLTALPKGFALMVGDVVMYSEAMSLGGFALLLERLEMLRASDPARMTLGDGAAPVLDAAGEHAWFVWPSVLDLLAEQMSSGAEAELEVTNVTDRQELQVAVGLGRRAGLELAFDGALVRARKVPAADPVLDDLMARGREIPAALWWRVYDTAQTALTPDSAVSRRHAGVNIITEDGQIIGRTDNDDDSDPRFLALVGEDKKTEESGAGNR